jgi:hypothetical protein
MDFKGQGLASGSKRDHTKTRGKRGGEQPLKHPFDQGLGSEDSDRENEKGKEKEVEKERGRDRIDRERAVVAAAANGGDEGDDGEGGSPLHQNLASASSALHGLLRKLGAGFDDLLPSSIPSSNQNSRLRRILSGLRAEGEEGRQLESLSQLCELLSIGTEDSLSRFSVDLFVPVLVGLLSHEHNPDMMLLAARALTHLCDVLPSSCGAVVHYGAVPSLCARLLTIEYIDLAEQVHYSSAYKILQMSPMCGSEIHTLSWSSGSSMRLSGCMSIAYSAGQCCIEFLTTAVKLIEICMYVSLPLCNSRGKSLHCSCNNWPFTRDHDRVFLTWLLIHGSH